MGALLRCCTAKLGCRADPSQAPNCPCAACLQKAVKNSLKAAGVGWLAVSALTAYNVKEQSQKADVGLAGAAAQAALGVLCLWRGMSD